MSPADKEAKEWAEKFVNKTIFGLLILPLVMWLWPETVPFQYFEFWRVRGNISVWFSAAWPIFVWGASLNIIHSLWTRNHPHVNKNAEAYFRDGALTSAMAGIGEEVTFRWLFFLTNIVSVQIVNFFFFGFLGFGFIEWVFLNITGPLANWTTLGYLETFLFHETGWAVGAAMIATNSFFRDGHRYQGLFGWINSWFAGMFLFWIMFKYGLPVAIFIHFVYNFLIDVVCYADAALERARGYV